MKQNKAIDLNNKIIPFFLDHISLKKREEINKIPLSEINDLNNTEDSLTKSEITTNYKNLSNTQKLNYKLRNLSLFNYNTKNKFLGMSVNDFLTQTNNLKNGNTNNNLNTVNSFNSTQQLPLDFSIQILRLLITNTLKENNNKFFLNSAIKSLLINKGLNINKNKNININNILKLEQTIKNTLKVNSSNNLNTISTKLDQSNIAPMEILYEKKNNNHLIEGFSPILNQYIKSMSKYNLRSKGVFMSYSKIVGYFFNSVNSPSHSNMAINIYKLLVSFFKGMYSLIGKPVFVISPNKIVIKLFYFLCLPQPKVFKNYSIIKENASSKNTKDLRFLLKSKALRSLMNSKIKLKMFKLNKFSLIKVYPNRFKLLLDLLSKFFNKPVELELTRLHKPYLDTNIFTNLLSLLLKRRNIWAYISKINRKNIVKGFNYIKPKLSLNNNINNTSDFNNSLNNPAYISGLNIKVAGRLMREAMIPKVTVKKYNRGAIAPGKINSLNIARVTKKNRKGALSITVTSGHNFF